MVVKLLKDKLSKTRNYLHKQIGNLFDRSNTINPELISELEAILIQADLGVSITDYILEHIQKQKGVIEKEAVFSVVRNKLLNILEKDRIQKQTTLIQPLHAGAGLNKNPHGVTVILVLGVNGSGKTTTIAKLAYKLKENGEKVLLAAADTFRAAAIEQLDIWAKRIDIDIIKNTHGTDPSAVTYDAVDAAIKRDVDFLIIDTAGRFHNKTELIEELKKIDRTINKKTGEAPSEKLLIIDATCGQNALSQARQFHEAVNLTGIIVTKLDGTAKGGILVSIEKDLGIPVKFIGAGQELSDLEIFDPQKYIDAII